MNGRKTTIKNRKGKTGRKRQRRLEKIFEKRGEKA
jgi:hypothetical protein